MSNPKKRRITDFFGNSSKASSEISYAAATSENPQTDYENEQTRTELATQRMAWQPAAKSAVRFFVKVSNRRPLRKKVLENNLAIETAYIRHPNELSPVFAIGESDRRF